MPGGKRRKQSPRQRNPKVDGPDPVDVYVGDRIRQMRTLRGITQKELAGNIGVKFQQLQKYERGANRVSVSRLVMVAKTFDVPCSDILGIYEQRR